MEMNSNLNIEENANFKQEEQEKSEKENNIIKCCRSTVQSDSTSIISDSSDGAYSENLTDSESGRSSSNLSLKVKKNAKLSRSFDSEYPQIRLNQRSKSHMFKRKKYIENVVNEETAEEDSENQAEILSNKLKPLRFSNVNFNDDLPSNFSKNTFTLQSIKSVSLSPSSGKSFKGHSKTVNIIAVNMDPVVEVKEEENKPESKPMLLSLNSPRIKYMTDNREDVTIQAPNYTSSFHFMPKDYSLESGEIIAEDNNENIVESDVKVRKKESLHKILENIIDKEDNYNIQELNVNAGSNANFEPIKEENNEEEESNLQIKDITKIIPVSDEFEKNNLNIKSLTSAFRRSVLSEDEDLINELDEEVVDKDEKDDQ